MNKESWILFLILILFSASVSAEFYRYVDKDGNVLYTDDLSQVPEAQRSAIRVFDESKDVTSSTTGNVEKQREQLSPGQGETSKQKGADNFAETRKDLDREQEALEKERESLEKEREELFSKRFKPGDPTFKRKMKELNEKTEKLKEKLQVLKKKQAAYDAELEAFNAKASEAQK